METVKHRTQISLEDWQYHMLLDESRKTKKSLSQIIREMISEKFSRARAGKKKKDSIFEIIGIAEGNDPYVSRDHDKYLYGKPK